MWWDGTHKWTENQVRFMNLPTFQSSPSKTRKELAKRKLKKKILKKITLVTYIRAVSAPPPWRTHNTCNKKDKNVYCSQYISGGLQHQLWNICFNSTLCLSISCLQYLQVSEGKSHHFKILWAPFCFFLVSSRMNCIKVRSFCSWMCSETVELQL